MRRLAPTVVAAIACFVLLAPRPAAASSFLQAVYGDFRASAAYPTTGLVLADHIGPSSARVTIALGDLVAGHQYRVVFSSERCFDPDNPSAHVSTASLGPANDAGAIFESFPVSADGAAWRGVWSVRLIDRTTASALCLSSNRLEWPTPGHVDGAFARFGARRGFGVLAGSGEERHLTLGVSGLGPNVRYRLLNISVKCSDGDPAVVTTIARFRADASGMAFISGTVAVDSNYVVNHGALDVERRSTGEDWGCASLHPYTLFLPPS